VKKHRLNIALGRSFKEKMDGVVERDGLGTITNLIRRSLSLYMLIMDNQIRGGKMIMKGRDGKQQTIRIL